MSNQHNYIETLKEVLQQLDQKILSDEEKKTFK